MDDDGLGGATFRSLFSYYPCAFLFRPSVGGRPGA